MFILMVFYKWIVKNNFKVLIFGVSCFRITDDTAIQHLLCNFCSGYRKNNLIQYISISTNDLWSYYVAHNKIKERAWFKHPL